MNLNLARSFEERIFRYHQDEGVVFPDTIHESLIMLSAMNHLADNKMPMIKPRFVAPEFKKVKLDCGNVEQANEVIEALQSIEVAANTIRGYFDIAPTVVDLLKAKSEKSYRIMMNSYDVRRWKK